MKFIRPTLKTVVLLATLLLFFGEGFCQTNAWINELHYQNTGIDDNEAIEIVIESPGTLQDYEVLLYDASGNIYDSQTVDQFTEGATSGNFTLFFWEPTSIQNGTGGIALTYLGSLISGQFLSYGGVVTAVSGAAIGETSIDIGSSEDASTGVTSSLQLLGSGGTYQDFIWFSFNTQTFGANNMVQTFTGSANGSPYIESITQNPIANNVTSSNSVSVTARVLDSDGLASVVLKWGLTSGSLSNQITMYFTSAHKYVTGTSIPAQSENTSVYYRIEATDNNGQKTTSSLRNYTVLPDNPLGLALNTTNQRFLINFDITIPNVNNGKFTGNGLKSNPATGALDSDTFKIEGFSSSPIPFGGDYTTLPKLSSGVSSGGVSEANSGLYAFTVSNGNNALGVQSSGGTDDFNPGKIIFRFQNITGSTITSLSISYKVYVYNDQARSTRVDFYHGDAENNLTQEANLEFATPENADADVQWKSTYLKTDLENLSIQDDEVYYLVWNSEDNLVSGSGARDEFAIDDIELIANPTSLTSQIEGVVSDMRIDGNVSVKTPTQLTGKLSIISGTLTTNNILTFKSSADKTATVGDLSNGNISGQVITERYFSAKRAFRFFSSPVNSIGSIQENWQEGGIDKDDNPTPGFGTHITGSITGGNGFDATPTGNPSLFGYDNSTQQWETFLNTDTAQIEAAKAYRLMVRGDRSIDVTDNSATPTSTVLRTKGNLLKGDVSINLNTSADAYNFVGNPYLAVVDMASVMSNSTNVNPNNYYVWDVSSTERGKYIIIDLSEPTDYHFIQPGQAIFVRTFNNGSTSILFKESDKVLEETANTVFKPVNKAKMKVELFSDENLLNNLANNDEVTINFAENGEDDVIANDAPKMGNPDENLAIINGSKYLSLEYRSMPDEETELPLFFNQLRTSHYTFKIEVSYIENYTAYFVDTYSEEEYELENNTANFVAFEIDESIEESFAPERFKIIFKENQLSISPKSTISFTMYPNPLQGNQLNIISSIFEGNTTQVHIYNQLGQLVFNKNVQANNKRLVLENLNLSSGLFVLQLKNEEGVFTKKLIFE
ncbi:T9SS type A sorting domain-containing protein [Mesonia aquimarina]|uniref:T9SS type A sorting domain-containing protein n=1 Tax=Mesonia aquimarina TaxID=1504967 RepID=UPI000EF6194C|nr:T9SS type A sorting domain-containing protein [Mesonia aquimarina]